MLTNGGTDKIRATVTNTRLEEVAIHVARSKLYSFTCKVTDTIDSVRNWIFKKKGEVRHVQSSGIV